MGGSSETQNFENTMLGELGKPGLNLKRERTKAKIAEENQQLTDYLFRGSTVPQKEPTSSPEPTLQTSSSEITESITQAAQPEGYKLYRNAVHHLKRLAKKKTNRFTHWHATTPSAHYAMDVARQHAR